MAYYQNLLKMKKYIFLLLMVALAACQNTTVIDGEPKLGLVALIVALIAGIYEVIARVIPTVGNYSWLAKIIDILVWISDFLNRRKAKKLK